MKIIPVTVAVCAQGPLLSSLLLYHDTPMAASRRYPLLWLLALSGFSLSLSAQVNGQINVTGTRYAEVPGKTLIIQHPAANDAATFFATNTEFLLGIHKPDSMEQLMIALRKDAEVASCTAGPVIEDYQQFRLVLKSAKDKMWFVALFRKQGISTVRINRQPVMGIEHM